MTACLTRRKLSTGNVVVPYKVGEAGHARDAMTKTLYALLFEWIIKQINKTLEVRSFFVTLLFFLLLLSHVFLSFCLCSFTFMFFFPAVCDDIGSK